MDVPATIQPVSCPVCWGRALLPEAELLRLPYTILFRCPYCQAVADTVGHPGSLQAPGEGDARAA